MIEYGNPQLANGEAGYYLTTLEAAVQFIATLTPQTLQSPSGWVSEWAGSTCTCTCTCSLLVGGLVSGLAVHVHVHAVF